MLDNTLADPSCRSQPLLRRLKLRRLAQSMADSIVSEDYGGAGIFEYYPFSDLSNLGRLFKEHGIRPPENTLKAIYCLIDCFTEKISRDETKYRLGSMVSGLGCMGNVLRSVTELDLAPQFDIGYIDRAIEKARKVGDSGAVRQFEDIKKEILRQKDAYILSILSTQDNSIWSY